jgi:methionyl-tRNA formyltransferase
MLILKEIRLRHTFDVGVVVSFGHLLPSCVLHMFNRGAVNIHPSLLPRYRGAAPIQHAIMNGDYETGIAWIDCIVEIASTLLVC